MQAPITVMPIGTVHNSVDQPVDCAWGDIVSHIALDPDRFSAESLAGIEHFSHVEVVFAFHRVPDADLHYSARHPRGRTDWPKVGIFAQRGKDRPNRIGVTACRLLAVRGLEIEVQPGRD
jgi:tRNA (Thr-GGU) A37 N-methylase